METTSNFGIKRTSEKLRNGAHEEKNSPPMPFSTWEQYDKYVSREKAQRDIEKAVKMSIEHWERMIKWVETQNPRGEADVHTMNEGLDYENWYGKSCPLCALFKDDCEVCPLSQIGEICTCKDSVWRKVSHSNTWAEWLINARDMLKVLKMLCILPLILTNIGIG